MLSPRTWLRRGDPKQEATAISGWPALATTTSATQSATQFPIANTVSPRIATEQIIKYYTYTVWHKQSFFDGIIDPLVSHRDQQQQQHLENTLWL